MVTDNDIIQLFNNNGNPDTGMLKKFNYLDTEIQVYVKIDGMIYQKIIIQIKNLFIELLIIFKLDLYVNIVVNQLNIWENNIQIK